MTNRVSPSQLATYLTCPRQYEFDYVQDLNDDQSEMERYFNRGDVLDTTLQQTAESVSPDTDTETVRSRARETFSQLWSDLTDRDTYPSAPSYEYDRRVSAAAIEDYLDPETAGDGITHLRRSLGTEVHLEWTDSDFGPMHGYADNIVETDDGLLIIDYKASYSGRRFPNKSGSDLEKQVAGTGHYPSRLKKWLQIGMYCRGVTDHHFYSADDEIRFLFYGLIDSKDRTPTREGYTVDVTGKSWEMTDLYRDNQEAFRALISDAVTGIQTTAFDPTEMAWELIQDDVCGECAYQQACGDYLAEEVRFS